MVLPLDLVSASSENKLGWSVLSESVSLSSNCVKGVATREHILKGKFCWHKSESITFREQYNGKQYFDIFIE